MDGQPRTATSTITQLLNYAVVVSAVAIKSCYYQLRRISSVRKYLSTEATVKLVTSLILSHLDYCNSLLSGRPASSVQSLRRIQDCAARLILKKKNKKNKHTRQTDHITPLFKFLHWLPIQQRIQYKINTLCYKCVMGTALSYLCDCLQLYTPSRILRSACDTLSLQIPLSRLFTIGSRVSSVFGPSTGNDLPLPLRQKASLDSFKFNLKTFLFPKL